MMEASLGSVPDAPKPVGSAIPGGAPGFRELYETVGPSLYVWARLRLCKSGHDLQAAEDLVQEVWLRAMETGMDFEPHTGSFRAWIFGIAKNVAYEMLRRRLPGATAPGGATASRSNALDVWPEIVTSIRTRIARDESVRLFLDQVGALDSTDRMLVIHCGLEGAPCTLAATRLGLGAEAAGKRWQRLRKRLRAGPFTHLLEP